MLIAIVVLIISQLVMGYFLYKAYHSEEKKENKEKRDMIKRENKHYNNVFNYNVAKAYGGE